MKRILFIFILCLHIGKILHKQVDEFCVILHYCEMESAKTSLLLLVVNIDGHICSEVLVD